MKPTRSTPKLSSPRLFGSCTSSVSLLILFACASLLLPVASALSVQAGAPDWVPFPLHSVLRADYGPDVLIYKIPALDIRVVEEVIKDKQAADAYIQRIEIEDLLQTPVPTVTPHDPTLSAIPTRSAISPTPTAEKPEPTSSPTPSAPTYTPSPTQTPAPTEVTIQPSATSGPIYLPSPTATKQVQTKPTSPPPTRTPQVNPPTAEPIPTQPADPYPKPDPGSAPDPTKPAYPF